MESAHTGAEIRIVLRGYHVEVLLQHAGTVKTGDAQCDRGTVLAREDRSVYGAPNLQGFLDQRTIVLEHAVTGVFALERPNLPVEKISIVLEGKTIGCRGEHSVDRVRDPHLLVERETDDR